MSMKRNCSKKLSKTIALAVMAMSVAGFASVASAAKVTDIDTTSVGEAINFTERSGEGLASGQGIVATNGEDTLKWNYFSNPLILDLNKLPSNLSLKSGEDIEVNGYGIAGIARNSDSDVSVNIEAKKITLNSTLGNPVSTDGWDVISKSGIYAGGATESKVNVNIKATELNFNGGSDANDPFVINDYSVPLTEDYTIPFSLDNSAISTNRGYNQGSEVTIKVDVQDGDINITNMDGISTTDNSSVTIQNVKDINYKNQNTNARLINAGNSKVEISGKGNINADNLEYGILSSSGSVKINMGGDINLTGNGKTTKYSLTANNIYMPCGLKGNIDIESSGTIKISNFDTALFAEDTTTKVSAKEDINLESLGQAGLLVRKNGNIELTSEEGTINISGKQYGIYHSDLNSNIVVNGKATIEGNDYGVYASNCQQTSTIKFNDDVTVKSSNGEGIHFSSLGDFIVEGSLNVEGNTYGVSTTGTNFYVNKSLNIKAAGTGFEINNSQILIDNTLNIEAPTAIYVVLGRRGVIGQLDIDLSKAEGDSSIKGDINYNGKLNIVNGKNLTITGKSFRTNTTGTFNLDLQKDSTWNVTGDSTLTTLSGTDGVIKPSDYTVTTQAAAEGTSVNVVGEAGELNDVAGKLFYTNYVNGEVNLSAKAVIESEAARESANMLFKEDNGQGYINEQEATDTEIFGEFNESINKNTNVTVTETGTWAPTGENAVPSLKGEAGSAVDMTKANSLKVDSYSGETTMLYGHEESDPTQIIGGDINIGKAEEGSKVTMSTDNKGINTEDNKQVAAVMNAMAQKLTYAEAAENPAAAPVNNLSGKVQIAEGLTASSASIAAGDIKFDKEGKGSVDESTIENKAQKGDEETATMKAVKGALVSGALMMRAESNDLLKRMGDVRLAEEERGLWAKYYGGKYELDSANAHVSYKAYQLGYDTKAGKNWTVGGAVSYNEGKDGKTELKNTAVGVYGTWADDKGQYIDLITKIGWLKNDFDVAAAGHQIEDSLKTTGMSMSAEYGKRFENKAGGFIEPNAELTFAHLNGKKVNAKADGGSNTLGIDQDDFNSLVGRLGLRIGHKSAKSSVYAKVALAHEFAGDFDVTFSAPGEPTKATKVEFKDTWGEFQIGGTTKVGKAGLLYANYQRSFAGDVKEKYRVDAGLRWSF